MTEPGKTPPTPTYDGAAAPQPPPEPGQVDVADVVIEDIQARVEAGLKKYGTKLQTFNGRDARWDLYQELIDAVMYLRQDLIEIPPPPSAHQDAIVAYELDGVDVIKLSPNGRYIFTIPQNIHLGGEQRAMIQRRFDELFSGERPFLFLHGVDGLKVIRLEEDEDKQSRPSLPQEDRDWLLQLAGGLDEAYRSIPTLSDFEWREYITITDNLARQISQRLREIAQRWTP